MPEFTEVLHLCLHPVGIAHEFALSSQISDAEGTAVAAAMKFQLRKRRKCCEVFCEV